jgi:hypothetical protein
MMGVRWLETKAENLSIRPVDPDPQHFEELEMPMDRPPVDANPPVLTESEERFQWIVRSAAIISMLLAMTVLNQTNVMVPKRIRTAGPLNVNLPRVTPGVGAPSTIVLEPVPAPTVEAPRPQIQARPVSRPSRHAVPSLPDAPQSDSGLMLQMPGPSSEPAPMAELAHPAVSLPIHPSVSGDAGPDATNSTFKGLHSPKVAARKVIKPAGLGSGLKSGSLVGTDRKVVPASIPGQVGSMKTGNYGKVAPVAIPSSVGTGAKEMNGKVGNVKIPGVTPTVPVTPKLLVAPATSKVGLLSKPSIQLGTDDGR